jgi:hypothetical protein
MRLEPNLPFFRQRYYESDHGTLRHKGDFLKFRLLVPH